MSEIAKINETYYNNAYKARFTFLSLLHMIFSFDQQSKAKRLYKVIMSIFSQIHSPHIDFLDFGFGRGTLILKIRSKKVSVFGCELSFEAIKNVGKTAQCLKRRLILFHSDELQGTYKNDKYDVISCSHVLEHVDDDVGLLKHFNRLLKREGILVLNLPVNEVWNDPKHAHKYDRESIVKLMTNNGFKILQYTEADRWSAFILNYELHTRFFTGKFFGKSMRLLGAILPATLLDITEKILPAKYGFQQSIIVSQKLQD